MVSRRYVCLRCLAAVATPSRGWLGVSARALPLTTSTISEPARGISVVRYFGGEKGGGETTPFPLRGMGASEGGALHGGSDNAGNAGQRDIGFAEARRSFLDHPGGSEPGALCGAT